MGDVLETQKYAALIEKVRNSNSIAWEELYKESYKSVWFTIKKFIHDDPQAEDLLQDTYVQAYQKLDSLENPEAFGKWICMIAANQSKNYLKKKKPIYFNELENDEFDEIIQFEDEDITFQPEASMDLAETVRIVNEMLEKLPEKQKIALALHYGSGLSAREISNVMECKENTAKGYLKYGLEGLRKQKNEMEAKGIKLRSVAFGPFLYWFFRNEIQSYAQIPEERVSAIYDAVEKKISTGGIGIKANLNESYDEGRFENSYIEGKTLSVDSEQISSELLNPNASKNGLGSLPGKTTIEKISRSVILKGLLGVCMAGALLGGIHHMNDKTVEAQIEYESVNNMDSKNSIEEPGDILSDVGESTYEIASGTFFDVLAVYGNEYEAVKEKYETSDDISVSIVGDGFKFGQPVNVGNGNTITEASCRLDSEVEIVLENGKRISLENYEDSYVILQLLIGTNVQVSFRYQGETEELSTRDSLNGKTEMTFNPIESAIVIREIQPLDSGVIEMLEELHDLSKLPVNQDILDETTEGNSVDEEVSDRMTAVGELFIISDDYADEIANVQAQYEADGYTVGGIAISGFRFDEPMTIAGDYVIEEAGYNCDYDTLQMNLPEGVYFAQDDYMSLFFNDILEYSKVEITFEYLGRESEISIWESSDGVKNVHYTPVQPQIEIFSIKPLEQGVIDRITEYGESLKRYREDLANNG